MQRTIRRGLNATAATFAAAAMTVTGTAAEPAAPAEPPLKELVNDLMGLRDSELLSLELDPTPGISRSVDIMIDGTAYSLDLVPHSVRADDYRLYYDHGDGQLVEAEPGPVRTLRGVVMHAGEVVAGSAVRASVLPNGLHARITLSDDVQYWLEPISDHLDGRFPGVHALYADGDALCEGECGVTDRFLAQQLEQHGPDLAFGGADGSCPDLYYTQLACDADFQYFQDWGDNTEGRINTVINAVNGTYEDEVEITHVITAVIIRTSQVYSSSQAGMLLGQFRSRWLSLHGDIVRDAAHLFTGKDIIGGTIGIAWGIGEICTDGAYCLSQSDFSSNFSCVTDLTTHELGHLWGAFHCSCPSFTMNPFITCANQFSTGSESSIISHRNSRPCLDCEDPTGGYCIASSSSDDHEYIQNVSLNTIDHDSGATFYSDFTGISTSIAIGTIHTMTVTLDEADASTIGGFWVDWNHDEDFTDINETMTASWSGSGPYTHIFVVPTHAVPGLTRMRVRVLDSNFDPLAEPCAVTSRGEVEDYALIVATDPPPPNDNCDNALDVGEGMHDFTTMHATTDGPDEFFDCDFKGYTQIGSDVWFRYVAPCTGVVTVELCDVDYDSKVAVYSQCPEVPSLHTVACNDDSCGLGSLVTFPAIEGSDFLIRIGGFEDDQGSGTMTISGPSCEPDCPQDLDGDGSVGFADLLELLSFWGPCEGCAADLDGDGAVGFADLLEILSFWGPC